MAAFASFEDILRAAFPEAPRTDPAVRILLVLWTNGEASLRITILNAMMEESPRLRSRLYAGLFDLPASV